MIRIRLNYCTFLDYKLNITTITEYGDVAISN